MHNCFLSHLRGWAFCFTKVLKGKLKFDIAEVIFLQAGYPFWSWAGNIKALKALFLCLN